MLSTTTTFPSSSFLFQPPPYRRGGPHTTVSFSGIRPSPPAISDDFVLKIAEQLEDSIPSPPPPSSSPLEILRSSSSLSLLRTPWPNRRNDAFRFTDLSYLRSNPITIPTPPQTAMLETVATPSQFESLFETLLAVANGNLVPSISRVGRHSDENVYVGAHSAMPAGPARERVDKEIRDAGLFDHKDLFYDFNAVGLQDLIVVYVPEGVKLGDDVPVHLMFGYGGAGGEAEGSLGMSNPRVLVVAEKGADVSIVEEHFGLEDDRGYWANAVVEVVVEEGARVVHSYVQRQGVKAAHTKWTIARQVRCLSYWLNGWM